LKKNYDCLILGHIVLYDKQIEEGYIAVQDSIIMEIDSISNKNLPSAVEIHDHRGCFIFPSAIDSQVHSRSQKGQEDFIYTTASAAAGGVGTIIDMPYDEEFLVSNAKNFNRKKEEATKQAKVDFGLYGTISPLEGIKHIDEIVEAGAIGFKFSTFSTDPIRFPRIPPYLLYECFEKIASYKLIAGVHNENDESIRYLITKYKNENFTDYRSHNLSRPKWTENIAIVEVYEIAAATGCSAHIVHCSNSRGYDICLNYRAQGFDTTIETCLHYMVLSEEEDVCQLVGKAKINPPVRSSKEREALWKHLDLGNITVVSTDHVSWSIDRKSSSNMFENSSGVTGLEVLLPLMVTEAYKRNINFSKIAKVLAYNPSHLFRIYHKKGALEIGKDADLVILSKETYTYNAKDSGINFAPWSPYDGKEMLFKVKKHMLRGKWIFEDGNILCNPGYGEFISPVRK